MRAQLSGWHLKHVLGRVGGTVPSGPQQCRQDMGQLLLQLGCDVYIILVDPAAGPWSYLTHSQRAFIIDALAP